jgi:hypothetical protein
LAAAPSSCSESLKERSKAHHLRSDIDVNFWSNETPTVERVRPKRCPRCEAAASVPGCSLVIIGHGVRARQVRGPKTPADAPVVITIDARRFRCTRCKAIMLVVPREVLARRHYAVTAIGLALLLIALDGEAASRRRVCASRSSFEDPRRWPTARRWLAAIDGRRLLQCVRGSPPRATRRQRAERAAMTLASFAPPALREAALEVQVFAGAALAA